MDKLERLVRQKRAALCKFQQQVLLLDARAALYWPQKSALLVSDLHLEKGSYYAQFASPLPHYDSLDTLKRLQLLIDDYQPHRVVCLGDSFHDLDGVNRLSNNSKSLLFELTSVTEEWIWVLGNHDPILDNSLPGKQKEAFILGDIWLTHEPEQRKEPHIIGHYHPKMSYPVKHRKVSGKAFLVSETVLIMPAFGSYTGGLDSKDPAFQKLIEQQQVQQYLLANDQIWSLAS